MNFVFVSPQFPKTYWNFCDRLKHNGVNVLGIGDSGYDEIPDVLKERLTEYYRVDNMENYDEMLRAMGFFTFKYGKIDWVESNNEYWLEQDARLPPCRQGKQLLGHGSADGVQVQIFAQCLGLRACLSFCHHVHLASIVA